MSNTSTSEIALPEWGLFVREPFAERIMAGTKTWELRKRSTNRRGRIGIISDRGVIGTVELCDVAGPLRVEDLAIHVDKHRAPMSMVEEYAAGRALWAWVLAARCGWRSRSSFGRGGGRWCGSDWLRSLRPDDHRLAGREAGQRH